ncbi:hypothetical protein B0H13DRAFT_1871241 [Mycena leptocephala]|nr:hypothetical protein B0H13DRAFT_1871241 [Mycena leptocephala]
MWRWEMTVDSDASLLQMNCRTPGLKVDQSILQLSVDEPEGSSCGAQSEDLRVLCGFMAVITNGGARERNYCLTGQGVGELCGGGIWVIVERRSNRTRGEDGVGERKLIHVQGLLRRMVLAREIDWPPSYGKVARKFRGHWVICTNASKPALVEARRRGKPIDAIMKFDPGNPGEITNGQCAP